MTAHDPAEPIVRCAFQPWRRSRGWAPDVAAEQWLARFDRLMAEVRCG